jgi:agmatinase
VETFNPNGITRPNGNFFGFPYPWQDSAIVFFPVPWDATTSYGDGACNGPQSMIDASVQLDFYDPTVPQAWQIGHGTYPLSPDWLGKNLTTRAIAKELIQALEQDPAVTDEPKFKQQLELVNQASGELNHYVYQQCQQFLQADQLVVLVGGDHSCPLGFIQALTETYEGFGILHIDAHCDLRKAYEGFIYSHASVMYNVLQLPHHDRIQRIVQVCIRDYCLEEIELIDHDPRLVLVSDRELKHNQYQGQSWAEQCETILKHLPPLVYVSFDIDGLDPRFCPHTGTPVPGGLEFDQALFLIEMVVNSGRKIIGFDLCEVAPGPTEEWDANVGARILYRLSNLMYQSQRSSI